MSERVRVPIKPAAALARSFTLAPFGLLQRKCACGGSGGPGGECEQCKKKKTLQARAGDGAVPATVPPIVYEVLRSPSQPLDPATRAFMELRFGHDFSRVRVHTDAKAAESARAVNGLAYAVGNNVVFGSGRYAPQTGEGRRLLAHELAHTIQQAQAETSSPAAESTLKIGDSGDAYERDADAKAAQVAKAEAVTEVPVQEPPQGTVQRRTTLASSLGDRPAELQQDRSGCKLEIYSGFGCPPSSLIRTCPANQCCPALENHFAVGQPSGLILSYKGSCSGEPIERRPPDPWTGPDACAHFYRDGRAGQFLFGARIRCPEPIS
jgi:hypothetical protein